MREPKARIRMPRTLAPVTMAIAGLAMTLALSACGPSDTAFPDDDARRQPGGGNNPYAEPQSVFGPGGLQLFGPEGEELRPGGEGGGGIAVNSYLWRASLDTVSFMPLASADPFGGVIITDWYSPPDTSGERFKVNVYILGRDLRADGLKAAVFRQRRQADGSWVDAQVEDETLTDLENAILTRARELRIASLQ